MSHSDQRFTFVVCADPELAAERAEPTYNGVFALTEVQVQQQTTNNASNTRCIGPVWSTKVQPLRVYKDVVHTFKYDMV